LSDSSPSPPASPPAAIALPVDNSPVRSRRKKRKQRQTELKKNAEKKRKKVLKHALSFNVFQLIIP
jgi:hypothetical protein